MKENILKSIIILNSIIIISSYPISFLGQMSPSFFRRMLGSSNSEKNLSEILNPEDPEMLIKFTTKFFMYFLNDAINQEETKDMSDNCKYFLGSLDDSPKYSRDLSFTSENDSNFKYTSREAGIKFLLDSTITINELNYYENCLTQTYYGNRNYSLAFNYSHIILLIDSSRDNNGKFLMDFEIDDKYYVKSYCIPTNHSCSNNDYKLFTKFISRNYTYKLYPENSLIEIFQIYNGIDRYKYTSLPLGIFIFVLFFIQFLLVTLYKIVFYALKSCFRKSNNNEVNEERQKTKEDKENMIYKTNKNIKEDEEVEDNDENDLGKEIDEKKNEQEEELNSHDISDSLININKKYIPKWLNKLKNCFSFTSNFNELFNTTSDLTEMNNYSGLTVIRGLNAVSMIMTFFGATFISICNYTLKKAGAASYKTILENPLYFLLYFSARISPRVMISCSGYTFVYKFLSFMNKNGNTIKNTINKFFRYHIYNYILAVLILLFFKYTMSGAVYAEPGWLLFQKCFVKNVFRNSVDENNKFRERLGCFYNDSLPIDERDSQENRNILFSILGTFGLSHFYIWDDSIRDVDLYSFVWLPFNEIIFFIFGILILSLYNCRLRIDIIIIILFFINYAAKIILSVTFFDKPRSVIYFFLFKYGRFMNNPIYNFPYFLIGLFFGLNNYYLEKNSYQQDKDIYNKINTFDFSEKEQTNNEDEEKKIENEADENKIENDAENKIENESDENKIENESDGNKIENGKNEGNEGNITQTNTSSFNKIGERGNMDIINSLFLKISKSYVDWTKSLKHLKFISRIIYVIITIIMVALYLPVPLIFNDEASKVDSHKNNFEAGQWANKTEDRKKFYNGITYNEYIEHDINYLLIFDIEIFIIIIQCLFFLLKLNGEQKLLSFFTTPIWGIFDKCYFSFTILHNLVLLFILYSSENKIPLTIFNIMLYFLLCSFTICIMMWAFYIYYELPMKKITRFIINKNDDYFKDEEERTEAEDEEERKAKKKKY